MFKECDGFWKDAAKAIKRSVTDTGVVIAGIDEETGEVSSVGTTSTKRLKVYNGTATTPLGYQLVLQPKLLASINHNYGIPYNPRQHRLTLLPGASLVSTDYGNGATMSTDGVKPGAGMALQPKRSFRAQHDSVYMTKASVVFQMDADPTTFQLYGVSTSTNAVGWAVFGTGLFGALTTFGGVQSFLSFQVLTASTGGPVTVTLNDVVVVIDTTNASGDLAFTAYEIGKAGTNPATEYVSWLTDVVGDTVYFISVSPDPLPGVYSISGSGCTTSYTPLVTGTGVTFGFLPVTFFSEQNPVMDLIDPTKVNLYGVSWGFGVYKWWVRHPETQVLELVHSLNQVNTSDLFLTSPTFQQTHSVAAFPTFVGACSMTTYGSSVSLMTGATEDIRKTTRSYLRTVLGVSTERTIVSLYVGASFNQVPNESEVILQQLSVTVDGIKTVSFKIIINPDRVGGGIPSDYPQYQYIQEGVSPLFIDENSLTFTGGEEIFNFTVGNRASDVIDLRPFNVILQLEDRIVIVATSDNVTDINLTVTLIEDF